MPEDHRPYSDSSGTSREQRPGARPRLDGGYDDVEDEAVAYWEDEPTDAGDGTPGQSGMSLLEALRPAPPPDDGRLQEISSFLSREFEGTARKLPAGPLAVGQPGEAGTQPGSAAPTEPQESAAQAADTATSGTSRTLEDQRHVGPGEEPFFPIPDVIPPLPHEDTETAPPDVMMQRERKSPLQILMNLVFWSILFAVFFAVLLALIYLKYARDRLYSPQEGAGREFVLTVNPGDKLAAINQRLRSEDMLGSYMGIDDAYLMKLLARINENSDQIKSGAYRLNTGMSLNDIYERMLKGSQDFKFTIQEGLAVRDVAQQLKRRYETFNEEEFIRLTKDQSFIESINFRAPSLEGYLYPSTYFFGPGMKEGEMIRTMVNTFTETMKTKLAGVPSDNLTFHEHIIMASLIEREARIDKDRPLIASVLFNRLRKGMPLQVDATVLYAMGSWNKKLTTDDYQKVDSPYNTYRNKGLPPGPICSPRLASIRATYEPASTDFLFYVHTGRGDHAFAKTYEEHRANVRLYQKNRGDLPAEPDGKAPDQPEVASATPESGTQQTPAPSAEGPPAGANQPAPTASENASFAADSVPVPTPAAKARETGAKKKPSTSGSGDRKGATKKP